MARPEDARVRRRVCPWWLIPASGKSLLPTNPVLAALVERSADRRISAGFMVAAAAGATDRPANSRLTARRSHQRPGNDFPAAT